MLLQTMEAGRAETQADTRLPAEARDGTEPSRASLTNDPRDPGDPWTTALEGRIGRSLGELDIDPVVGSGQRQRVSDRSPLTIGPCKPTEEGSHTDSDH